MNLWGWVSEILKGLALGLKILFGLDKPAETKINEKPVPDALHRPDDELLDELRRDVGAARQNGSGHRKPWPRDAGDEER
jgi:hypothetical protein